WKLVSLIAVLIGFLLVSKHRNKRDDMLKNLIFTVDFLDHFPAVLEDPFQHHLSLFIKTSIGAGYFSFIVGDNFKDLSIFMEQGSRSIFLAIHEGDGLS